MKLKQFDGYVLLEHLGKGGMATVYRASHEASGHICAVKIFKPSAERTPEVARRLRDREVRMLVSVQHPNIVKFYDMGEVDEQYYFSMEFVENSLIKRMRRGDAFSLADKIHILRQTANALTAIHHQGIVHRDVKPGNILLDQDPNGTVHVKLTDLGIAKSVSETDVVREQLPTKVPGTAKYLAPEQIRLEAVDGRADVFSLGVVSYELLTGTPPFRAESSEQYLKANVEQYHEPVHEVDEEVPPFVSKMVDKMLVKDREERYDSDAVARDLELVYQHLISGADLTERTNPASIFYDMDVDEMVHGRRGLFRCLSIHSYALAVILILAGAWLTRFLWPSERVREPEDGPRSSRPGPSIGDWIPPQHPRVELPPPTAADLLATASASMNNQGYWRALAFLQAVADARPDRQERQEAEQLLARTRAALVERLYRSAAEMVGQSRFEEADVILAAMRDHVPDHEAVARLAKQLREARQQQTRDRRWNETWQAAGELTQANDYKQAAATYRALAEEFASDLARAAQARGKLAQVLQQWGKALLKSAETAAGIEELLQIIAEHTEMAPDEALRHMRGALYLKLGHMHKARVDRQPERYQPALDNFRLASRYGNPAVHAQAREAALTLERWKRDQEAKALLAGLSDDGLQSSFWIVHRSARSTRKMLADGVVQFQIQAGEAEARAGMDTPRLDRLRSFSVAVKLTAPSTGQEKGTPRAGLELRSSTDRVFQVLFDGKSYFYSQGKGGALLRNARDNGREQFYELGLRYDADKERVTVVLEGKEFFTKDLRLLDVQIRLFLTAPEQTAATVRFKDFRFEHNAR